MSHRLVLEVGTVLALAGLVGACSPPASTIGASAANSPSVFSPGPSRSGEGETATAPSQPAVASSLISSGPPTGLIALQEYVPGGPNVFAPAVFQDPLIAGVALRVNWIDLEPDLNTFDWQIPDQVFAQATTGHKWVVLILVPGFGTPAWALAGTRSASFVRQYGLGAGNVGALPMPWDSTYLSRWFTFLQVVAARYGSNPALRMIAAAGPSSVSAEMSLPNTSADIDRWMALDYTSTSYEAAWRTTLQAYGRIFPGQYISLALYPGLPIGTDGRRDPSQRTATPEAILASGLAEATRLAVQTSGLTGTRTGSDLYNLVSSNSGRVVTGFQLTTSATNNPAQMGDASSSVHALTITLELGVAAHVDFLEVYQADVLNPAMRSVLSATSGELSH